MSTGSMVFMGLSWLFVLSLTAWSYRRILRRPTTAAAEERRAEEK